MFITISFIYFILPIQGVYGYIIVLFISEILNFVISLGILVKETKFKFDFTNWIIKPGLAITFAYFALNMFKKSKEIVLINFIMQLILFIAGYILFLILSSGIEKRDIKV